MKRATDTDSSLISIIVPIYNEQNNVEPLVKRLEHVFDSIGCQWELVFALDPCPDRTREKIVDLIDEGYPIRLVTFSRRIGKPLSLLAGLDHAVGDAGVVIDADLQDPPELIEEMYSKWREGYEVVIAQRRSRKGESFFYLACANVFYWLMNKISEVKAPKNTGDFRLMDARVLEQVRKFRERHGFLRGISALAGFRTAIIPFDRDPRHTGRTQINFSGAVNIALDGIVPFSRVPVRLIFLLGLFLFSVALLSTAGWVGVGLAIGFKWHWPITLLTLTIVGMTGVSVTCMGVLGEYLVRTYEESRHRPLYIVDELVESERLTRRIDHK